MDSDDIFILSRQMGASQVMTVGEDEQWLVVLGELLSTVKEGVADVSVGRELPVVIVEFSFWPGMDCSRQQTKQRFFPSCVSLAQSVFLFICLLSKLMV